MSPLLGCRRTAQVDKFMRWNLTCPGQPPNKRVGMKNSRPWSVFVALPTIMRHTSVNVSRGL